jgi:hypothetical protein
MPNLDLNETELAAGAAVAMDMAREDRKERAHVRATQPSIGSAALTIIFVVGSLVIMLALMLIYGG